MERTRIWKTFAAALFSVLVSCAPSGPAEPVKPNNGNNNNNNNSNSQPQTVEVTGISLSPSTLAIYVNEEKTLTATVSPSNATDKTVTWSSDKTSVATVTDGKVKGVAAGTAVITAKAGNKTATCSVTVSEPVLVVTGDASAITVSSANLGFTVNIALAGKYTTYDAGILIGEAATLNFDTDSKLGIGKDGSGKPDLSGTYSIAVTGLDEKTKYYYKAYCIFDGVTTFGEQKSFETAAVSISSGQMIDLGLSVKWAAWNVGATKPEELGSYFAWGEAISKTSFNQDNYRYGIIEKFGTPDQIYKYNLDEQYGVVDGRSRLTANDDAAHANWGENWRMPTDAEKTELLANTTHVKYTLNGTPGWLFTSTKNGATIFFPAAGHKEQSTTYDAGDVTMFWTATLKSSDSKSAHMACSWLGGLLGEGGFEMDPLADSYHQSTYRTYGLPVRAVSGGAVPTEAYVLTTSEATDITAIGAKVAVSMTPAGTPTEIGVLYTSGDNVPLVLNRASKAAAGADGVVTLGGLDGGTNYYACAYAVVDGVPYYGNTIAFKTKNMVTLEVLPVENVTHEGAKMNARIGNVSDIMSAYPDAECGIAYEAVILGNHDIFPESTHVALTPAADGAVTTTVTGLAPDKKYFYMAYLKYGSAYYYSQQYTEFTTAGAPLEQWVDLGLSVLWASLDLGATKAEDWGGRYAWGETEAKTDFSSYKWADTGVKMTKYVTYEAGGTVDNKTTLEAADDAATAALGAGVRTPTKAEFEELIAACTVTEEKSGGRTKIKFTASNGKSVYFEYAGYYWTCDLVTTANYYAYMAMMTNKNEVKIQQGPRATGNTKFSNGNYVRPVKNKPAE